MVLGVIKCNKNKFLDGLKNFYNLQENVFIDKWQFWNVAFHGYIYIYTYKGKELHINGNLSIKAFQKPEINICISLLKSLTQDRQSKNYILGELKRYVRINTEELNFLKKQDIFSL